MPPQTATQSQAGQRAAFVTNCAYQRAQLRALDEHGEPIIAADDTLCSSFAFVARGHNVLAKSALYLLPGSASPVT